MDKIKRKAIKCLKVFFHLTWTPFMIAVALIVLLFTLNQRLALMLAHWVWAPGILWVTQTKIKVQGQDDIDFKKPHIFVMNHQSSLDIPIIFKLVTVPLRFVVKKELKWIPFLGWYIWAMGMIFVDRRDRKNAIKSLNNAVSKIHNGASLIAYPEGTRSDDGRIKPFKKGIFVLAIEAGVPIVPVAIEGSRIAMPKNTWTTTPHTVCVEFGKPIPTKDLERSDRDQLRKQVRSEIIKLNISLGGKGESQNSANDRSNQTNHTQTMTNMRTML